mgnify:CR=1 FL=1
MMGSKLKGNDKFMSSVKVGPKGQIVIPKEVRDMFQINPGDTLLLLADAQKGIAIERYGVFAKIAGRYFCRQSKRNLSGAYGRGFYHLCPCNPRNSRGR